MHCAEDFIRLSTLDPLNNPAMEALSHPLYRGGDWGSGRLTKSSKVSRRWLFGQPGLQLRSVLLWGPCSLQLCLIDFSLQIFSQEIWLLLNLLERFYLVTKSLTCVHFSYFWFCYIGVKIKLKHVLRSLCFELSNKGVTDARTGLSYL